MWTPCLQLVLLKSVALSPGFFKKKLWCIQDRKCEWGKDGIVLVLSFGTMNVF